MNDRPAEKSVRLAALAACLFTLAALVEIVPSLFLHGAVWLLYSGIGFAGVAVLWWLIVFQWKRKIER